MEENKLNKLGEATRNVDAYVNHTTILRGIEVLVLDTVGTYAYVIRYNGETYVVPADAIKIKE